MWHFKNGEAYYDWALKAGTTTNRSPQDIHQLGLDQVKTIQSRSSADIVKIHFVLIVSYKYERSFSQIRLAVKFDPNLHKRGQAKHSKRGPKGRAPFSVAQALLLFPFLNHPRVKSDT